MTGSSPPLDHGKADRAAQCMAVAWRRIVAAINELQREEPVAGERRH